MNFAKALERFAGTDPKEVAENVERSKAEKPPGAESPGGQASKLKRGPGRGRVRKPRPGV